MTPSRTLAIAMLLTSLALGVLAAPAAAQLDPRLTIVNGIPGRTVDVCIGNNEVRSNLKYGGAFIRSVGPGSRTLRFRAAGPGSCNGTTLAQEQLNLVADDDFTIVGTKQPDKVVVFNNRPHPNIANARARFRYAGDLGDVNMIAQVTGFAAPSALPTAFSKGQQYTFDGGIPFAARYSVFRAGAPLPFRETPWLSVQTGQQLDAIIVGSSTRNDKLVVVRRATPAP